MPTFPSGCIRKAPWNYKGLKQKLKLKGIHSVSYLLWFSSGRSRQSAPGRLGILCHIPIDKVLDASLLTDGRSPIVSLTVSDLNEARQAVLLTAVLWSNLFIPKKPCKRTMHNKQKLEKEKKKNDVRNNSLQMASEEQKRADENVLRPYGL
ncbi:Uncharacterized protein Fot_56679 [Forsythia ovata]|uniref:Uncharacterized protein n=1 Tax=Forsythia ovata TaxID=205694 RepID=A0ABD1NYQ0_9LAMI